MPINVESCVRESTKRHGPWEQTKTKTSNDRMGDFFELVLLVWIEPISSSRHEAQAIQWG